MKASQLRSIRFILVIGCFVLTAGCSQKSSDQSSDPAIQDQVNRISAIDNHAHPTKALTASEQDSDNDALPADGIVDLSLPVPFRPGSPLFVQAWKALFGVQVSSPAASDEAAQVNRRRRELQAQKGDLYPSFILNQCQTDVMLANRVAMGRGLPADRFKWVPFADMFLFPLNNSASRNKDPEHAAFIRNEEVLLNRALSAGGARKLPSNLDEYLTFISHTLSSWKAGGAVAVKFEFAYLRDLQISNPPRESAERVYAIYAQSSEPTPDDYKLLQDFLFRYISLEAGRLGLPVHMHSSIGAGSYFQTSNANPLALQSLFNDPNLRKTKFVMLHSAWPFEREAAALILKPNVYLDTSGLSYLTYPVEAAHAIRLFLEAAPEKVLYGSDATPLTAEVGWEETAWLGSTLGRKALAIALTGMVRDGEITRDQAAQYAQMVLRGNAHQLYGF